MSQHTAASREFFGVANHFASDAQMISSSFRMKTHLLAKARRLRWLDDEALLEGWPNLM